MHKTITLPSTFSINIIHLLNKKMNSLAIISSCLIILFSFPSMISAADGAFNITQVLAKYNYNTFNNILSQTNLAEEINNRKTITVLAVKDGSVSSVSSKPREVAKRIIATHVLLDFYDMKKLKNPGNGSITTLFQTTGMATGGQGYLQLRDMGHDQFKIGSSANNAQIDVSINKVVYTQGYLLSVLDVSSVINVPGIENIHAGPAHSPRKMLTPAAAPGPHHKKDIDSAPSAEAPGSVAASPDLTSDADDTASAPAPAPAKSGVVKVLYNVKFLVGLTVFLVPFILF